MQASWYVCFCACMGAHNVRVVLANVHVNVLAGEGVYVAVCTCMRLHGMPLRNASQTATGGGE